MTGGIIKAAAWSRGRESQEREKQFKAGVLLNSAGEG